MTLEYQAGFRNSFQTEAIPGTLPADQNSPQKVARGLYAEQISGTSFTTPRAENLKTWVYRLRPSVMHGRFEAAPDLNPLWESDFSHADYSPNQYRWDSAARLEYGGNFVAGLRTVCGAGSPREQRGASLGWYGMNQSMAGKAFYSADGEIILLPQNGKILVRTELGDLEVEPGEIVCIPRGYRMQVNPVGPSSFGYYCENFGLPFKLPELGPIGANGLANPRHFVSPKARYDSGDGATTLIAKIHGHFHTSQMKGSPFDVVAWTGNYAPYKYDLRKFNTIGTVSFDHPDPSIFTVLTSPSDVPGCANMDFVIFPPRWMVAENTFRPPYYHRNVMSEWMGLLFGAYDAKEEGFLPGGASLHNCMSGHGPDREAFDKASTADLKPQYLGKTMAFMFESRYPWCPTAWSLNKSGLLQKDYQACWESLLPGKV